MAKNHFLNLPVGNLAKSVEFFTGLGFTKNDTYSNDEAAAIVIDDALTIMLIVHPKFLGFVAPGKRALAHAHTTAGHLMAVQVDSRDMVDTIVDNALASGATEATTTEDHGWMYVRGFADVDGHIWEFCYIDETAAAEAHT